MSVVATKCAMSRYVFASVSVLIDDPVVTYILTDRVCYSHVKPFANPNRFQVLARNDEDEINTVDRDFYDILERSTKQTLEKIKILTAHRTTVDALSQHAGLTKQERWKNRRLRAVWMRETPTRP
jgi:hypothetical protein